MQPRTSAEPMARSASRRSRSALSIGLLFGSLLAVPATAGASRPPTLSLELSATSNLDPAGTTITATGSGYDETRGIYVAFCVVPPPGETPTPCGGGMDLEGETGASQWISSNPPDYGVGLAQAYAPGGSFTVDLYISALLSPTIDCRQVQCAIVTRSDHTRLADRSLDVIVPVFFDAVSPTTTALPSTAAPATPGIDASTVRGETTAPTVDAEAAVAADPASALGVPRGAASSWPVWVGSIAVAAGLVVLAPKRRGRRS